MSLDARVNKLLEEVRGLAYITRIEFIDKVEDLSEEQLAQVQRVNILRGELTQLNIRAQELNVLLDAYGYSLKTSLTDDEKKEEVIEES